MSGSERSAAGLWKDYVFLTNEMLKFISRREMDMFYSLLEQRETLQPLLEAADPAFRESAAGKELYNQALAANQQISDRLKLIYNQTVRQLDIDQSYEGTGGTGARIDFQR